MEGRDIYIFDETNPLLQSRRNILFHDHRADSTFRPSYLIELPQHNPNAPVPSNLHLENRIRPRGPSIINIEKQEDLIQQDEEEQSEYFKTRNLRNYRKSILVDDPNILNGLFVTEHKCSDTEFKIIEPLKGTELDVPKRKETTEVEYSTKDTASHEELNLKEESVKAPNSSMELSITESLVSITSLQSNNITNETASLSKKETSMLTDNAFMKVIQKSPFTNENLNKIKFVPAKLKIMLTVVPSYGNLNSKGCQDNNCKANNINKHHRQFDNSITQQDTFICSKSDQNMHNSVNSNKKLVSIEQQTSDVNISNYNQNVSNYIIDRSNKYEVQLAQTENSTDFNRLLINYLTEDKDKSVIENKEIDSNKIKLNISTRERQPNKKKEKNKEDMVAVSNNKESLHQGHVEVVKPQKYSKRIIVISKRYHIQLLKQKTQGKSFRMLLSMDSKCKVDLKYQGPIEVTNYYSAKTTVKIN